MAKTQNIMGKKKKEEVVEEPWMVVSGPGPNEGKPIYIASNDGIGEERARELASRLQNAVAVPRPASE